MASWIINKFFLLFLLFTFFMFMSRISMHSHAALIVCNYMLPDQSISCLFITGLWHFSAPPAPPLAICQFSKSVFVYNAALRSVHLVRCVSIYPRVVHPFHSLSVTLHLSIPSQTLAGGSCWNIYWSVFLFSLSLLYLFSSVSLALVQSNKVQRCQLSEMEEGLKSSTESL